MIRQNAPITFNSEILPDWLKGTGSRMGKESPLPTVSVKGRCYAYRGLVTGPEHLKGWIAFSANLMFGHDPHIHFAPPAAVHPTDKCFF